MEIARAPLSLRDSITRISHESSALHADKQPYKSSINFFFRERKRERERERERERGGGAKGRKNFFNFFVW